MAPLATNNNTSSTSSTACFDDDILCDYNAGLLDVSEHSAMEKTNNTTTSPAHKKVMKVMEMMTSSFHNSAPLLDFDLSLLEEAIRHESNNNNNNNNKKVVRFAEYDEIHHVTHRNDMAAQDMDAMYLSHDEQTAAKQAAFQELSASFINNDGEMDDDGCCCCLRGLENHMAEQSQRFRETVNKLYDIVYDCQTFEDENGVQVPAEYLAQYMVEVSSYCAEEARERALRDEQEAADADATADSRR
jgi:hypothetical protein